MASNAKLEAIFLIDVADIAVPLAVIAVEEAVGEGLAAGDDVAEWVEESAFIVSSCVEIGALGEAGGGDVEHFAGEVVNCAAAGDRRVKRLARDGVAQRLAFLDRPMLDPVPRGVERAS